MVCLPEVTITLASTTSLLAPRRFHNRPVRADGYADIGARARLLQGATGLLLFGTTPGALAEDRRVERRDALPRRLPGQPGRVPDPRLPPCLHLRAAGEHARQGRVHCRRVIGIDEPAGLARGLR